MRAASSRSVSCSSRLGADGECFHFPVIQQLDAAHALLLGIEAVLRDLAEPDADIAGPAEAGKRAHGAAECFARQLFGKLGIVRKGKQIAVDIIKINAVSISASSDTAPPPYCQ